jgi:predicted small secreted protein
MMAKIDMKQTTKKKVQVLTMIALGVAAMALSACNTVSGVGKDIQEASDNVKNAIEN